MTFTNYLKNIKIDLKVIFLLYNGLSQVALNTALRKGEHLKRFALKIYKPFSLTGTVDDMSSVSHCKSWTNLFALFGLKSFKSTAIYKKSSLLDLRK